MAAPGSTRDPLPNREIERPEVLPRGWLELQGQHAWGRSFQEPVRDRRWTGRVRYGFTRRSELWWEARWQVVDLYAAGEARRVSDLADPTFGWRLLLARNQAPARSAALEVSYKQPRGGPPYVEGAPGFSLSTGTPDLAVALSGRHALDGLLLSGEARYVRRFAGEVTWIEPGKRVHHAPPDIVSAQTDLLLQAGPLAFSVMPTVAVIPDTPVQTDTRLRLLTHPTRGVDLAGHYWTGSRTWVAQLAVRY